MNISNPIKLLWGRIRGNLADQTDLVDALALKANLSGDTFTGPVTVNNITINGNIGGYAGIFGNSPSWHNLNNASGVEDVHTNTSGHAWLVFYEVEPLFDVGNYVSLYVNEIEECTLGLLTGGTGGGELVFSTTFCVIPGDSFHLRLGTANIVSGYKYFG